MMPSYHLKYPTADKRQHDGQGTLPEPTPNKTKLSPYDEAAREYRDMLMSQGRNYDPNGDRGSHTSAGSILLSKNAGWDGRIRSRQIFSSENGHADRTTSEIHPGARSAAGTKAGSDQYRVDRRLAFPLHVKIAVALGSVLFVGSMWLLGRLAVYLVGLLLNISSLSGFWWLVGAGTAYALFSLVMFSVLRVAGISDRRIAEIGRGK